MYTRRVCREIEGGKGSLQSNVKFFTDKRGAEGKWVLGEARTHATLSSLFPFFVPHPLQSYTRQKRRKKNAKWQNTHQNTIFQLRTSASWGMSEDNKVITIIIICYISYAAADAKAQKLKSRILRRRGEEGEKKSIKYVFGGKKSLRCRHNPSVRATTTTMEKRSTPTLISVCCKYYFKD